MSLKENAVCRMELAQARGSSGRISAQRLCQRRRLDAWKVSGTRKGHHMYEHTIYALESATRRGIYVVTIRAE